MFDIESFSIGATSHNCCVICINLMETLHTQVNAHFPQAICDDFIRFSCWTFVTFHLICTFFHYLNYHTLLIQVFFKIHYILFWPNVSFPLQGNCSLNRITINAVKHFFNLYKHFTFKHSKLLWVDSFTKILCNYHAYL